MGLFSAGERVGFAGLDQLATLTLRTAGGVDPLEKCEHWAVGEDSAWRWFERESYVGGRWVLTGLTTPINKTTGEKYTEKSGYLPEFLVPTAVREAAPDSPFRIDPESEEPGGRFVSEPGSRDRSRLARHGRPPSRWLRSLNAEELRIWLDTVNVPEADVSGMTFLTHLTRDHGFSPSRVEGLTEAEQAKLHAAAHYGY